MSVRRARVIKAADVASAEVVAVGSDVPTPKRAVVIPKAAVAARADAERIVAEAEARAKEILDRAEADAKAHAAEVARAAREQEVARLAAAHLALRAAEEARATREIERTVAMATMLAERIVGEAIALDRERVAFLATEALRETRGARRLRLEACPEDVDALRSLVDGLGYEVAEVVASPELTRGSIVVDTELGRVDARLEPRLAQLAVALREVLETERGAGR